MGIVTLLVFVFLMVALMLVLMLCDHRVDNGYVVGKSHYPMRAIQYWDSFLHRHTLRYLPERYVLYVADCKGVEEITVTEDEFESYSEGQEWQRK